MKLNQHLNADKIVKKFNISNAHEVQVSSVAGKKLVKPPANETRDVMAEMAAKPFRRIFNAYGKPHWETEHYIIKYIVPCLEYSGTEVK
ncbi:hypothetical protein PHMEG_0004012 [Phytophthora megakarya]|uniref:Uncharacterized protein n=1 Tax=Phytophthora megakarya TaxID=4795 RepID=A0A225WUT1_9STRA|nr:hypothetical protein PHMEG_0004012 [Phytophthora megakarya]